MSSLKQIVRHAQKSALCGCGGGVDGGMRLGARGACRAEFEAVALGQKQCGKQPMIGAGSNLPEEGGVYARITLLIYLARTTQTRSPSRLQRIVRIQGRRTA